MTKIVHFQRYSPDPEGPGGHHRMYQVYQDLISSFGYEAVGVLPFKRREKQNRIAHFSRAFSERSSCVNQVIRNKCNPTYLVRDLLETIIETRNPFIVGSLDPYLNYINENGKPDVCIVDYPNFIELARYNQENDIVTIYTPQNLDSFTAIVHNVDDSTMRIECSIKWLAELEMFNLCQERLMISLSETSFIRGLGLPATYYPYLPVNKIKARLMQIREGRDRGEIEKGLLIMIGSVFHKPTREGFSWLLRNIKAHGFSDDMRIVVGGRGGEGLIDEFGMIPNVEIKGQLSQEELEGLMKKACAILIPQQSGFGSLTRISEMSCANIPVITSEHASTSMLIPPGVHVVPDETEAWLDVMRNIVKHPRGNKLREYIEWEENQPKSLKIIVEKYL